MLVAGSESVAVKAQPEVGASAPVRTGAPERVRGLDSVRTIATIAVFAYHFHRVPGGWVGLDVFFVLSGYLITSILLRSRRPGGGVTLSGFWGRRARRLLPASLVCICGTLMLGVVLEPDVVGSWARTGAAGAVWMANWQQIIAGSSYFDTFATPNALKHLWSLSVEEQFYVLWPLLVVFVTTGLAKRRLSGRAQGLAVGCSAGALSLVSAAIMWRLAPGPGEDPTRVWFGTDTRAMAPLMGSALAGLVAAYGLPKTTRGRRSLDGAGIAAVAILLLIVFTVDDRTQALWHGGMLAVAVIAAVWIASIAQPGRMSRVLARPGILVWIGAELTYALYLWHWPMIVVLTPERVGIDGWPLDLVRLGVTTVLALASWALIERPIRVGSLRRTLAGRPAIGISVVSVAVVTIAASVIAIGHPTLSERMDEIASTQAKENHPEVAATAGEGAGMRVAIFGDSVAWSYSIKVTPAILDAHHTGSFRNYSQWFCELFDLPRREGTITADSKEGCPNWRTEWAAQVAEERPDVVIFSVGVWEIFDRLFPSGWLAYGTPELDAKIATNLDDALRLLSSTGARVAVTTSPYPDRRPDDQGAPEWTQEHGGRPRIDHFNDLLRAAAARHGAQVVELGSHVCPTPEGPCLPLRYDGVHFELDASPEPILGWILDQAWAGRPAGTG